MNLRKDIVEDWIDAAREYIYQSAKRENRYPKDFAATLVAAVVGPADAVFIHVGDGAVVTRDHDEDTWSVPSWPMHGEYASTTYFVTDDVPNIRFEYVNKRIDAIAVFTDGIERLVLDFASKKPSSTFFNKMLMPLESTVRGRNRPLSRQLQEYLASQAVVERTDDDKTLILAKRQGD